MEKKYKWISVVMALLNLVCSIAYLLFNVENNLLWSAAFGMNTALILINIKWKISITPLFLLIVYYLYQAIIHWPQNGLLTAIGMKTELIVSLFAVWAFISIGFLYMINRNRW